MEGTETWEMKKEIYMKSNWKKYLPVYILSCLMVLAPMIFGIIYWAELPENVAIHFSLSGEPNGFSSKKMAVYGFPLFELAGQLLIIFSFLFCDKKKIPLILELLCYFIFPVCSIISGLAIYKDFMNIKIDFVFITILFVSLVYIISGNYLPKIHEKKQTGFSFIFNRILGWSFFISGIILFILLFTDFKNLIIFALFIPLVVAFILFILKITKSDRENK